MNDLDRRIEVVDGSDEQRGSLRRVSDLRALPFVVLLGEPGIGKSTVLEVEATHESSTVLKVRELINGGQPQPNATLYLDALDEYRTDGQSSDKVYNLADSIIATGARRWRLSCRSEDWRKEADTAPIRRTTGGSPIVVAQLLPLDHTEASAVLLAFGESDPDAFLSRAEALGAAGFVESPLSLKLLRTAVARDGEWPSTRYELFRSAVQALAYERNAEHKWTDRHAHKDIVAAARRVNLLMLASGANAVWSSNDEPPGGSDARAFLTTDDLQIERSLLRDVLDTPLFRGEGEAFEPMHRTIAEYLAGEALAQAVKGADGSAALPLSRAIALITGHDNGPPTELRGLYGWFAAHLAGFGNSAGARRLIEADAATVLAYGDAAVFSKAERRAILFNLDRNDPYFRASEVGITAIGGLAGEDLAAEFRSILTGGGDNTHRTITVLEALASGSPVASMRPLLREIALDPSKPEWQRWRAVDAWLNGAADTARARRELFDALQDEPASGTREALRTHLAAELPSDALRLADIKSILADFERSADDNVIMRLYGLERRLKVEPLPELFDEPTDDWRPDVKSRRRTIEIEHLIDHALAAAIQRTARLSADRVWRWTENARDYTWSKLGSQSLEALQEWLKARPGRDVAFFNAILADDEPDKGPWLVGNTYFMTTGTHPSTAIIRDVLEKAEVNKSRAATKRLLAIAVHIVRSPDAEPDAYWETYDRVSRQRGCKRLLKHLTTNKIEDWRRNEQKRLKQQRRREAKTKAKNLSTLAPVLDDLRVGRRPSYLDWAARLYFRPRDEMSNRPTGLDHLVHMTDAATASAIAEGWEYLATVDLVDVDAEKLGRAEGEGRHYYVEFAAVAGVDYLIDEERLPKPADTPVDVAIVILKSRWIIPNEAKRSRLEEWAAERLNLDPSVGAKHLLKFWGAALDSGSKQLAGIDLLAMHSDRSGACRTALNILLRTRRNMPSDALKSALCSAVKHIDRTQLQTLAEAAIADAAVKGPQRAIWSFVAFTLDPTQHGDRFLTEHTGKDVFGLFDDDVLSNGLVETFGGIEGGSQFQREAIIVELLGSKSSPEYEPVDGRVTQQQRLGEITRRAIAGLANDPHPESGRALARLVANTDLDRWKSSLRHAQAQQTRLRRDQAFHHPSATMVAEATAGGPPVNASDLRAVVIEELRRLRAELRTTDTTTWKSYWNLDPAGNVTEPLIENQCRDRLLDRLRDRLRPYRIAAAVPEAPRPDDKRADVVVFTGAGRNLPLEAKRHYNHDIWVAASTQLQDYAIAEGADGFGIYLVFWFGNAVRPIARHPEDRRRPSSADKLEQMLSDRLTPELRARTDVVVLDVSDPAASRDAKPRSKRARASTTGTNRRPARNAQGGKSGDRT